VVMLSFFSNDCGYCKRLDREAFSDDDVVAALEPLLCLSIDAHSETGRLIDQKYPTNGHYPALIFLDPDGSLRDRILGYLPTSYILDLVDSIVRDEGTLGDLRRQVDSAPEDLDKIWAYARRLDEFDDAAAYAKQVARLRELDPKGASKPLHHLQLIEAMRKLERRRDDAPLRKLLDTETYPELRFRGWNAIARHELEQAQKAGFRGLTEKAQAHRLAYHQAHFNAWPHTPDDFRSWYSNHVAWELYKDWALVGKEMRREAIEVARIAVTLNPKSADVLDTLACLLFSNGEVAEAVRLMKLCIQLDNDNNLWLERLAMFEAEES